MRSILREHSKLCIQSDALEEYCPKSNPNYNKYLAYRELAAALRAYNGWGCVSLGADTGYVEKMAKVIEQMQRGEITADGFQYIDKEVQ